MTLTRAIEMSLIETLGPATISSLTSTREEEYLVCDHFLFNWYLNPIPPIQQRTNSLSFLSHNSVWRWKLKLKIITSLIRGIFIGIGMCIVDLLVIKGRLFPVVKIK